MKRITYIRADVGVVVVVVGGGGVPQVPGPTGVRVYRQKGGRVQIKTDNFYKDKTTLFLPCVSIKQ